MKKSECFDCPRFGIHKDENGETYYYCADPCYFRVLGDKEEDLPETCYHDAPAISKAGKKNKKEIKKSYKEK